MIIPARVRTLSMRAYSEFQANPGVLIFMDESTLLEMLTNQRGYDVTLQPAAHELDCLAAY